MEWYWYLLSEEEEVILLRMFGTSPEVVVPEQIDGKPVREVYRYCFSEKQIFSGEEAGLLIAGGDGKKPEKGEKARFEQALREKRSCALAGNYITSVFLPDSLRMIGDLAFYQCRSLERISLQGSGLRIGSDVFMNCRRLNTFYLRVSPDAPSCLRQILAQLDGEQEVYFGKEEIRAALFFSEYAERYDLIGPAHIFELNIEGKGFRARQCFVNGVFQFSQYDQIFSAACDTEEETVLCRMAMLRMKYPFELRERAREQYHGYLLAHADTCFKEVLQKRSIEDIKRMAELALFEKRTLELCLGQAVRASWAEGVRTLLSLKEDKKQKKEEASYEFEDFS